jgi:hypothetical protein
MPPPSLQLKALWQKAISSPDQLTEDEKQEIRGEPDTETKKANILQISGLTQEEFMAKAARDPESLTAAESLLIRTNFHIRSVREHAAATSYFLERSEAERESWGKAHKAVYDPEVGEVTRAVYLIEAKKSMAISSARLEEQKAADWKTGPKWIQKVSGLDSWGLVAFRGASIAKSSQEWDRYLSYARRPIALGFVLIQGCGAINRTKEYEWYAQDIDDNDHIALLQQVILT